MGNKKTDVYEVTVGNIGRVYSGHSSAEAKAHYREYKSQSEESYGRASGEEVVMWKNSEPLYEHHSCEQETSHLFIQDGDTTDES